MSNVWDTPDVYLRDMNKRVNLLLKQHPPQSLGHVEFQDRNGTCITVMDTITSDGCHCVPSSSFTTFGETSKLETPPRDSQLLIEIPVLLQFDVT